MVRGPGTYTSLTFASATTTDAPSTSRSYSSEYTSGSSGQEMTTSSNASSIASHQQPQTPVEDDIDSCAIDPDAWFAKFHDDADFVQVSDELPTRLELEKAANIPVFDSEGMSRPFKSLYTGNEHIGSRQLIIFVRHFYCGACQSFLKALADTISPSAYFSLPTPTTITIIGCGAPSQIPKYTTVTACPFRIYTEPSRKLYKAFRMNWTVVIGKRPEFSPHLNKAKMIGESVVQYVKAGPKNMVIGGPIFQIGGEFLFEEGEPIWCHRMTTIRGHSEMPTLRRVLEMETDEEVVIEEAKAVPLTPTSPAGGLRLVWDQGNQAHLSRDSRLFNEEGRQS